MCNKIGYRLSRLFRTGYLANFRALFIIVMNTNEKQTFHEAATLSKTQLKEFSKSTRVSIDICYRISECFHQRVDLERNIRSTMKNMIKMLFVATGLSKERKHDQL